MPERDEDSGDDTSGGLVLLGRIAGAHGIRGEVKITSFAAAPEDIAAYGPLTDGKGRRLTIESVRALKGMSVTARIAGVGDRNTAEALKGVELFVERARFPETDEDEWYHADLIGLEALTPDGEPFGRIIAIQNFGAGDLLEICASEGGRTMLVPFTQAAVPVIDVMGGRVVVDQPEDMNDAAEK